MTTLFSYLLTFFAIIFWVFRVIATLLYQLDISFLAEPLNVDAEIVVLFLTIPCILLVIKRNIIGAALYVALYASYFGTALYNAIISMQATTSVSLIINSTELLLLAIGVLIPILTFFDILINKNRAKFNGDKKTDWFYKNEAYDRKLDERADKNQYKF